MGRKVIIDGVEVDLDKIARENQKNKTKDVKTSKQYEFRADSLRIGGINVRRINIQPCNSGKITVEVSGMQSAVESTAVEMNGGIVTIGGKGGLRGVHVGGATFGQGIQIGKCNSIISSIGRGSSIMVNDGVTIISGGDSVNISTSGTTPKLDLDIQVPVGTDIDYDGTGGDITIGDVCGDLRIDTSSHANMRIGKVLAVDLDTSGNAIIDIQQVNGDVNIDTSGNCDIYIRNGEIGKLKVDISGAGKVDVQCTAQRANLDVSGMGNIYVKHVVKPPRKDRSGMGSIRVGRVG